MKYPAMALTLVLIIFLTGCESDELGMKIEITEEDAPVSVPETIAEAKVGKLTIAIVGKDAKESQALADAVATAFSTEDGLDGVLTFITLHVRNRSQHDNPRASAEIDAICIWQESGEKAIGYTVRLRTFSIEIEDWNTQPKYLRDEAIKGMARELADEM
jgi:hypothetical protein